MEHQSLPRSHTAKNDTIMLLSMSTNSQAKTQSKYSMMVIFATRFDEVASFTQIFPRTAERGVVCFFTGRSSVPNRPNSHRTIFFPPIDLHETSYGSVFWHAEYIFAISKVKELSYPFPFCKQFPLFGWCC